MMRYFEIWLQENDEPGGINDFDICIRGIREPSIEEAEEFVAADRMVNGQYMLHVKNVIELPREEAEDAYDFTNEAMWPVFGE